MLGHRSGLGCFFFVFFSGFEGAVRRGFDVGSYSEVHS